MDKKLFRKASGINEPYASALIEADVKVAGLHIPSGAGMSAEVVALKKEMVEGVKEEVKPVVTPTEPVVDETPAAKPEEPVVTPLSEEDGGIDGEEA